MGAGRQLVSCVLVQSLSKYSRVGQLGPDTDRQLTSADTVHALSELTNVLYLLALVILTLDLIG